MYQFEEQHAYNFARHIGAVTKTHNEELFFKSCPYCHSEKDKNTFSINLKTGQFKCLRASCGVQGNMITLSKDFDFSLGTQYDEYLMQKKSFKHLNTPTERIIPKKSAIDFLEKRGISQAVAEKYEITTHKKYDNVLVFPFYDENNVLQFIKYRKTDFDKTKDNAKEWCEANCKPILFGMKQCNTENKTLIFTEGQMDSLAVSTCGMENAVSVPTGAKGFTWVPYCYDWIVNNFETIIVFGDYEKDQISLLEEISKRFRKKILIKHVCKVDYKDCKDANEILLKYGKEQILKCIKNAVAIPIKQITSLADVKDVDIFKLPKMKTGFYDIDRLLYGGLPFGGVVIISGKNGEGKSTFASQILANAINNGYKSFVYSGELPNYLFKSWLDFQIAGRKNIIEYQNQFLENQYKISAINKHIISEWYRDKCYIYDNSIIETDEKETLINLVEKVILQYEVKVVLVDNLMTAIEVDEDKTTDKYEKQSLFVKRLQAIAMAYDVLILLIAHKRKNNSGNNENDDVSGSADITNLATVTFSYGRDSKVEDSQRVCKVLKNRLFGRIAPRGFVLDYDEKSKRIYGEFDNLDTQFLWSENFEQEQMQKPIPKEVSDELERLPF